MVLEVPETESRDETRHPRYPVCLLTHKIHKVTASGTFTKLPKAVHIAIFYGFYYPAYNNRVHMRYM